MDYMEITFVSILLTIVVFVGVQITRFELSERRLDKSRSDENWP